MPVSFGATPKGAAVEEKYYFAEPRAWREAGAANVRDGCDSLLDASGNPTDENSVETADIAIVQYGATFKSM